MDELRAEYGLAPEPDLVALRGDPLILPTPPALRDPRYPLPDNTIWCRPGRAVPNPASGGTRPTVYFTLGTLDTYREVFGKVLAGAHDLPVDLVVTVGRKLEPATFGPQPAHNRIECFLPQEQILPACDLVVAHGGSGTLLGALAHGLPSLLLPLNADQPYNARRCTRRGARTRPHDVHRKERG